MPEQPMGDSVGGSPDGTLPGYKWTPETHAALQAGMPGGGIDRLTQLAMGNDNLVTNPGLMDALNKGNASPEQAQAINNFMSGLQLEQQVKLSRASGNKLTLGIKQQQVLDDMGVHYSDVQQTQDQANQSFADKLAQKGLAVVKDQSGNVLLDAQGQPVVRAATSPSKKGGWSFSRIFGDVTNALTKSWNVLDTSVTKTYQDVNSGITGATHGVITLNPFGIGAQKPDSDAQQAQYARDAGYDPNNIFSMIAYDASGKSHTNIAHLATEWDSQNNGSNVTGQDALDKAIQFSTNPVHYRQQIENDPTLDYQQKVDKLNFLGSDPFVALLKRVSGSTATIGNIVVSGAGLDPVKDPTLYKVTSAGVDFAASIFLDPTILAGKAFSNARLAQIGIRDTKGAIDPNKIRAIFTPMSAEDKAALPFVTGVQRRWTNYLGLTQKVGDESLGSAERAAAMAQINAQFPELAPMTEHFTGANQLMTTSEGKLIAREDGKGFLTAPGKPITTLEEAGDYLASKMTMVAASQGRAALESSLMPGATSLFGFRALKGLLANGKVGGAEKINLARLGKATQLIPDAADAIAQDGTVLAARDSLAAAQAKLDALKNAGGQYTLKEGVDAVSGVKSATAAVSDAERNVALTTLDTAARQTTDTGVGKAVASHLQNARDAIEQGANPSEALASAQRAAFNDPVLRGQIQENMARRGTINGEGFNIFGMIQARNELATRRLTSLLPRNTIFKLDDAASQENVYRYAQIYMNKGDAALTAARWAGGDEATRRALMANLQLQTAHAAGFGHTESGRKALKEIEALFENGTDEFDGLKPESEKYSGTNLDTANDPDLGGRAAHYAVHWDQVHDQWVLPNFAQLQRDANRFGLWDRILGRGFTSQVADTLMHGFKMIQLAKPSTFTRNMIEGWANAAFRGDAAGGIRAKALGVQVEKKVIDGLKAQAKSEGWTKAQLTEAIDKYSPLQRRGWLSAHVPHLIMGQWYRTMLDQMMGDSPESQYILDLLNKPGEAKRMMSGYGLQHLMSDVDPAGHTTNLANLQDGFGSAQLSFGGQTGAKSKIESWESAATGGFDGAQKYSRALGIRLASRPEYSRMLLDAAKRDDGDISELLKYIDSSPELQKKVAQMRFSSLYKDTNDDWVKAVTPEDRTEALNQLVRRQVADTKYMFTGQDGSWAQPVEDYFREHGEVPDGSWIQKNLKGMQRPEAVEAPVFAAVPVKPGVEGFVNALFEKVDKAYVRMVEDPIQRTTSMPLFLHNYGQARVLYGNWEKALVEEHGFTPEAADSLIQEAAMKRAWVKTESTIDDPGLKTQFDIVGRNFFAYSRATQAMIRRWGQAMVQDPTRMVKASLAIQGAEHAGVIWNDANGEMNFTFPGSGAFIHLLTDGMNNLPVMKGMFQIPTVPDLTGKVMLSMPGLENPVHLNATPLVNVPFRALERLIPSHMGLMDEIDRTVNGPIGAGQIMSNFEPTLFKKYFDAFNVNDRNGMVASATVGAIANLIAGGHMPDQNSTADQRQQWINNVRVQVRNQMFLRAIFGMWAPAPPSTPTNETSASKPDFEFAIQGLHSLDSEFKQLLNDMGGNYSQAVQLWTALHPDKLVYTQSRSGSVANKAYLPATAEAMQWTENNIGFINKYKNIAGYFLPESNGNFDSSAYATQIAVGLRERHTPEEFLNTALVNIARPEYMATTKKFDSEIVGAKNAGDTEAVTSLQTQRAAYVANFKAVNPLWKDQGAVYAMKGNTADDALKELRLMVSDKSVPSDVPKGVISEMLQSWDKYQSWKAANPANTAQQKDARTLMAASFANFMSQKAQSVPGLIDLYQGVFRQLDNKLIDLSASN